MKTLLILWHWLLSLFKHSKAPAEKVIQHFVPTFREEVVLGPLIRKTAGGNHGCYESNVGIIRKPIQP